MSTVSAHSRLEEKTQRYVAKMPYLKALLLTELTNETEIYQFINRADINFKTDQITDDFLLGLRGGMSDLFTDFKKQFEKLS